MSVDTVLAAAIRASEELEFEWKAMRGELRLAIAHLGFEDCEDIEQRLKDVVSMAALDDRVDLDAAIQRLKKAKVCQGRMRRYAARIDEYETANPERAAERARVRADFEAAVRGADLEAAREAGLAFALAGDQALRLLRELRRAGEHKAATTLANSIRSLNPGATPSPDVRVEFIVPADAVEVVKAAGVEPTAA